MRTRWRQLALTFLVCATFLMTAKAQPPEPSPTPQISPPQTQPAPEPETLTTGVVAIPIELVAPQFGFLLGSAAEGKLTLVVPRAVQELHTEKRTRTTPVTENGVTKYVQQVYEVTVADYKIVPATCSVKLKDVLRWDGSTGAEASAVLVQKFIDRRAPVLVIERLSGLVSSPVERMAIRPGALLVQSPEGIQFAAVASPTPAEMPAGNFELPRDPPPKLVVASFTHGVPANQEKTVTLVYKVLVPVTREVSVQVEVEGETRTETRQIQQLVWTPKVDKVPLSQLVATDKSGVRLTTETLNERFTQPTVCVDSRYRRFDPAYLVTLIDQAIILTPAPAPQETSAPPAAATPNANDTWIGRSVVPKPGVQLQVAGTKQSLDWRTLGPLPWKVTRENGPWVWIGKTWAKKSQVVRLGDTPRDQQLAQFSESVRKEPGNVWHYVNRSFFWEPHDVESVIADLNQAVRLDPKDDYIAQHRLQALQRGGHWQAAADGWNQLLRTNPKGVQALAGRAMLLAACPDPKIRNGRQALADATQAGELSQWQDFQAMDALAAAYAETGDFAKAVQWKEKANEQIKKSIVQPGGLNPQFLQMLEAPLNLYRQGQPYRLSMQPNPPPPSATAVP